MFSLTVLAIPTIQAVRNQQLRPPTFDKFRSLVVVSDSSEKPPTRDDYFEIEKIGPKIGLNFAKRYALITDREGRATMISLASRELDDALGTVRAMAALAKSSQDRIGLIADLGPDCSRYFNDRMAEKFPADAIPGERCPEGVHYRLVRDTDLTIEAFGRKIEFNDERYKGKKLTLREENEEAKWITAHGFPRLTDADRASAIRRDQERYAQTGAFRALRLSIVKPESRDFARFGSDASIKAAGVAYSECLKTAREAAKASVAGLIQAMEKDGSKPFGPFEKGTKLADLTGAEQRLMIGKLSSYNESHPNDKISIDDFMLQGVVTECRKRIHLSIGLSYGLMAGFLFE